MLLHPPTLLFSSPKLQVSAEAGVPLDTVLDAVRATAPTSAGSPSRDVDSKLPLSARARGRPRSAGPSGCPPAAGGSRPASPPLVAPGMRAPATAQAKPAVLPAPAAGTPVRAAAPTGSGASDLLASTAGGKLEQRVLGLQALLDVEEGDLDTILAQHPGSGTTTGCGLAAPAAQPDTEVAEGAEGAEGQRAEGSTIQTNPTFQVSSTANMQTTIR